MAKLHALGALALTSSAAGCEFLFPTAEVVDSIAPLLTTANLPLVAQLSHMSNGKIPMAEMKYFKPVGSHTAHICEATDAAYSSTAVVVDGESGDTDYPFGKIKVLATVGEYDKESGFMLVGVPDGMGTHLKDDKTVRYIFQSESYGPMGAESYPFIANEQTGATFTGSYVMYVDYDRQMMSEFMANDASAEGMVKGAGNLVTSVVNLKGNTVDPRPATGCVANPHYSNTDEKGCGAWSGIMSVPAPKRADWLMQSLCSAHLAERHQWGPGFGVEDDLFLTNEEWTSFNTGSNYTGIPAHAVDLATGTMYAVGAFTLGGFEKIVEVNCGNKDHVCFSVSGYNGNFGLSDAAADAAKRTAKLGARPDGTAYKWPQDIVPSRLYIGKKGLNAKGQPANDFLSRNGLANGQVYGFAIDMSANGPTAGTWRDAWHKTGPGGDASMISGGFYPIDWKWDGEVKPFMHDGAWKFQHSTADGKKFWTAGGNDAKGEKTEHNSPCPYGKARFVQGSTAGYYGVYDFTGVTTLIKNAGTGFPSAIPATYTALVGEKDVTAQIMLGNKGIKANGQPATTNSDTYTINAVTGVITDSAKKTFEDIDGLEWLAAAGTNDGYVVIQEDSGNMLGERMFISKVELTPGTKQTYYFVAMSGGAMSTRGKALVGVPAGTATSSGGHEFSGVVDMSGVLAKTGTGRLAKWSATAGNGHSKRTAEATVNINDKLIALGLQAHPLDGGIIGGMGGDRGGQIYAYMPKLPNA